LGSGFKKVGYYGLTVLGLKALDNAIGKWMDTKASLADKLFASFEAILASASSEEGGGEGMGEGMGEGGGAPEEFTFEK